MSLGLSMSDVPGQENIRYRVGDLTLSLGLFKESTKTAGVLEISEY